MRTSILRTLLLTGSLLSSCLQPAYAEFQSSGASSTPGIPVSSQGTFAARPTSPATGQQYLATDLGTGVVIFWTGSKWKPDSGIATIGGSSTAHAHTGDTVETLLDSYAVPAGLVSSTGTLRVIAQFIYTNSANSKTEFVRFAAAAGTGGAQYQGAAATTTTNTRVFTELTADNATNAQKGTDSNNGFGATGNVFQTSTVDMTAASFISFTGLLASAAESISVVSWHVEWIEL